VAPGAHLANQVVAIPIGHGDVADEKMRLNSIQGALNASGTWRPP
jgi:hypothetical protein